MSNRFNPFSSFFTSIFYFLFSVTIRHSSLATYSPFAYAESVQQKHLAVSFCRKFYGLAVAAIIIATSVAKENQASLEKRFTTTVQPFLESYCVTCHDHDTAKGDFDMSAFGSAAAVAKEFGHWDLAIDRLEANEMPPKKAKKFPSAAERKAVIDWI